MRNGLKITLLCGVATTLVASLAPAAPEAVAATGTASQVASPTSATDQLRSQRAQLVDQLSRASGARARAVGQLLAVEDELASVQQRLADAHHQLERLDAQLTTLAQQIDGDEAVLRQSRAQLASMVRVAYESSDKDGFAGAILSSNNFTDAMDRIRGAQNITAQAQALQAQISARQSALVRERSALQTQFAQAQQLEGQLNEDSGRLLAVVGQRDQAVQALQGQPRSLASQIASIDDQLAPATPAAPARVVSTATAGPVNAQGPCGNRFAFGNCTYYVATRRCIPWLGNAYQWWANARAAGYAEGQAPARGAVVVWGRGGSSPVGHVAYVEAVGPSGGIPAGSFEISEMNYNGWDRVNYRVVQTGSPGILGFIYGPA